MFILQGHEQGVIVQPGRGLAEHFVLTGRIGQQTAGRLFQHRVPGDVHQAIIHALRVAAPVQALVFVRLQQPVRRQIVQVDEIGVAGKGGEGLVGGVAVAGGTDGQDLPVGLSRRRQTVREVPGGRAQRAESVRGGQRGDRHQDSRCSHVVKSPFSMDFGQSDGRGTRPGSAG